MKNVVVYDKLGFALNSILNIDFWQKEDEFQLISGSCKSCEEVINKAKKEKIDILVFCMHKSDDSILEELSSIINVLSGVDVIVLSEDKKYTTIRECFIRGAFDYLILPLDEEEFEKVILRTNTTLAIQYVLSQLQDMIDALIEDLFQGGGQYEQIIKNIIHKIYSDFENNPEKCVNVTYKAKNHIYNEMIERKVWLEKFIYKEDFSEKYDCRVQSKEKIYKEWIRHFKDISLTIEKYRMIDDKLVYGIGKYVILHVDEKLSLKKVACAVFLNPSYISHIFKKITNMNFTDYIAEVKMDRAKILMRDVNLKVYEIAGIVGYSNAEYFARNFKAKTGYTPVEYMEILSNKYKN